MPYRVPFCSSSTPLAGSGAGCIRTGTGWGTFAALSQSWRYDEAGRLIDLSTRSMASGAGHDTAFLSRIAPAAMIFVPCRGGKSHVPEEWAEPDALAAGAACLLEAVLAFDAEGAGRSGR